MLPHSPDPAYTEGSIMSPTRPPVAIDGPRGWVLYDGECALCRSFVTRTEPILARRGFVMAPLQEEWVATRLPVSADNLLYDVRLLLSSGTIISGADVYLYLARRIWWAWWFWAIFSLPGLIHVVHGGYRWIADHRYCVGGRCHTRPVRRPDSVYGEKPASR